MGDTLEFQMSEKDLLMETELHEAPRIVASNLSCYPSLGQLSQLDEHHQVG